MREFIEGIPSGRYGVRVVRRARIHQVVVAIAATEATKARARSTLAPSQARELAAALIEAADAAEAELALVKQQGGLR